MNILIDTHILIWALYDPNRLSKKQQDELINPQNDIYVSTISLWELSLKKSINKIDMSSDDIDNLANSIIDSGFNILDLSSSEATSFHKLPRIKHKDPFDRMLIWQSISNNYHLMSVDQKLDSYKKYNLKLI